MNSDLIYASLTDLMGMLRNKSISSVELTNLFLSRIEQYDSRYNSYLSVTADLARAQAKKADQLLAAKATPSPLCGVPIAHKDLFCTKHANTTCASRMLENYRPPYDATVVASLDACGTVMLGKTNMDEFAMGSSNEHSAYGAVRNPWDEQRVPGGSSGGSAAALAAGLCAAATATDTGGSARQPAALCGLTALKPSHGRVSRYGMVAFASSLDQASILTRNAYDAGLILNAIAGADAKDSTCATQACDDYCLNINQKHKLRIGLVREWFTETNVSALAVEDAVKTLEKTGHSVHEVSLPRAALGISCYYVLASAECSSNLARYDGVRYGYRCTDPKSLEDMVVRSRSESLGDEVQRRILIGTFVLSAGYYDAYYKKAQQLRRLICEDFSAAFKEVDVLLGPTTTGPAFLLGEKTAQPTQMYLEDLFTIPASLAGLPAMSVPVGESESLPLGMHMVAPYFAESRLLALAHQFQDLTDWHKRVPNIVAH